MVKRLLIVLTIDRLSNIRTSLAWIIHEAKTRILPIQNARLRWIIDSYFRQSSTS
jgi:hypothetical protein